MPKSPWIVQEFSWPSIHHMAPSVDSWCKAYALHKDQGTSVLFTSIHSS